MAADPSKLKKRLVALQGARQLHENTWRECFEFSLPHLATGFNGQTPFTAGDIQQRRAELLDGTAGEAIGISADGIIGGTTPSSSRWFTYTVPNASDEEKRWLTDASQTVFELLHESNYDAENYDAKLNLIGAGWQCLYVDEADGGGFYCENLPLPECYIASSRPGGRIDTIYREFQITALAAAAEYGRDKVSNKTRQMIDSGHGDTLVRLLMAIQPRDDYLPGGAMAATLPYASCHMEVEGETIVREGGFHEFPVIVPRWRRIPNTAYGLGMMSDALPDTKSLQMAKRWEFAGAETAIAPPLIAEDDGVLNTRSIKLGPRKVIVAASVDSIKPLITGARVDFGQVIVTELQQAIRRQLMADLFSKLLEDPQMTATQVHAILGIIRQRMGPRFARLNAEDLQPLLERCYGLALRGGALGQPPASLLQESYTVQFQSPLARAQRMEDVAAMDRHETALLTEAQAKPEILDTYDWDNGARYRAEQLGVPLKLIPGAKQVAKVRKQRADAQQQAQAQAVAMEAGAQAAQARAVQAAA